MFWRLKKLKLAVAITPEIFIHHYGSKTVSAMKKTTKTDFELKNREYFLKKWQSIYFKRR